MPKVISHSRHGETSHAVIPQDVQSSERDADIVTPMYVRALQRIAPDSQLRHSDWSLIPQEQFEKISSTSATAQPSVWASSILPHVVRNMLASPPVAENNLKKDIQAVFASYDVDIRVSHDALHYTLKASRPLGQPAVLESRVRARKIQRIRLAIAKLHELAKSNGVSISIEFGSQRVQLSGIHASQLVDALYSGQDIENASPDDDIGSLDDPTNSVEQYGAKAAAWVTAVKAALQPLPPYVTSDLDAKDVTNPDGKDLRRITLRAARGAPFPQSRDGLRKLRTSLRDAMRAIAEHQKQSGSSAVVQWSVNMEIYFDGSSRTNLGNHEADVDALLLGLERNAAPAATEKQRSKGIGQYHAQAWFRFAATLALQYLRSDFYPKDLVGKLRCSTEFDARNRRTLRIDFDGLSGRAEGKKALKHFLTKQIIENIVHIMRVLREYEGFVSARGISRVIVGYRTKSPRSSRIRSFNLISIKNTPEAARRFEKRYAEQ